MKITVIINVYNSSDTIGAALGSIFRERTPSGWAVEVIVVDDGGDDGEELAAVVAEFDARLIRHPTNRGMYAARNTGIERSTGDIVTNLDADDEFVAGWAGALSRIIEDWPRDLNVCFSPCVTPTGRSTVAEPEYQGRLSLADILNERRSREYLHLYRGAYLRANPFLDLPYGGGSFNNVARALGGDFWISREVLRIYRHDRRGSMTDGWTNPIKAAGMVDHTRELIAVYGDLYRKFAPRSLRIKKLKLAVYMKLAGASGYVPVFVSAASISVVKETCGAGVMLAVPTCLTAFAARWSKKIGLVRKFG